MVVAAVCVLTSIVALCIDVAGVYRGASWGVGGGVIFALRFNDLSLEARVDDGFSVEFAGVYRIIERLNRHRWY